MWTTAGLVLYASLIILALGIGMGVLAGLRPGFLDTSVLVTSAISAAIPSFVAAIVLIALFAVKLRWFPALGNGTDFVSNLRHFTLPAVALALSSLAIVARVTRSAIREEADREHVQTAISRGIPRRQLVRRHILRNAAIPITTISGITIASLIAVAAVVETAFSMNGLGAYLVASAQNKDLAVVQGISLVLVTAFVVINMVVDLAYAVLDPRVDAGEPGPYERHAGGVPMSTAVPLVTVRAPRGGRAVGLLRGTGVGGDRSRPSSSRLATVIARDRRADRAVQPDAAEPGPGLRRPDRRAPARLRLRGQGRAVPAAGRSAVVDARPARRGARRAA